MPIIATPRARKDDLDFVKKLLLVCPMTDEPQKIVDTYSTGGELVILTKGKSTAWRHVIKSEEL